MNRSRLVFVALCSGIAGAAPGCAQIAGLDGDYRHVTSGGSGTQGGGAGLAGTNAGSSGTSVAAAGDAGASGEAGAAASDNGGTDAGGRGTGGASAGTGGGVAGKGGTSTGSGGDAAGAGGSLGGQGGEPEGTGGSAGSGAAAGMSGSAGGGGSWAGPVRIGYSEFHDSASGSDDASGHLLDATFELPAGTQEGDFIFVFFGVDHDLDITNYDSMMSGWTLLDAEERKGQDGQGTYLLYKFAGPDEPQTIVFQGINQSYYGVQGLLSVYRGVNRTTPVNAYDVVVVAEGSDGPTHIETPTPAITTSVPNCLLLAGLSPDSAIDAPVVTAWPDGFTDAVSVKNPQFPRPYGWANIYLAERTWPAPASVPAATIAWDIESGYQYNGALSFMLALAPAP